MQIVRDDQHGSLIVLDCACQDGETGYIQIVRRLVQHENIRHVVGDHQAAEIKAHAFPAAQCLATLIPALVGKERAVEPQLYLVIRQVVHVVPLRQLQYGHGLVHLFVLLIQVYIREIRPNHCTTGRCQLAKQKLDQRGLAAPVVPPHVYPFPAPDLYIHRLIP